MSNSFQLLVGVDHAPCLDQKFWMMLYANHLGYTHDSNLTNPKPNTTLILTVTLVRSLIV